MSKKKESKPKTERKLPGNGETAKAMAFLMERGTKSPSTPNYDPNIKCAKHPDSMVFSAYGLAGGGYGQYSYCGKCNKVLSKTEEES